MRVSSSLALARPAFSRYCGECHDGRLATAKPKALAVFDFADTRWVEAAKGV